MSSSGSSGCCDCHRACVRNVAIDCRPREPSGTGRNLMRLYRLLACVSLLFLSAALVAEQPKVSYPPPAEIKAAFLKLLDRPRVPLNAKVLDTSTKEGLV